MKQYYVYNETTRFIESNKIKSWLRQTPRSVKNQECSNANTRIVILLAWCQG